MNVLNLFLLLNFDSVLDLNHEFIRTLIILYYIYIIYMHACMHARENKRYNYVLSLSYQLIKFIYIMQNQKRQDVYYFTHYVKDRKSLRVGEIKRKIEYCKLIN